MTTQPTKPEKYIVYIYLLLIVSVCLLLYSNALGGEFVSDDLGAIVNNPHIGDLFRYHNPSDSANTFLYRLAGLTPWPYHLFNLLLHIISSLLVFFFLRLFFRPQASFWGALIFASQPVQVEAVSWIAGRPYPLMTVFLLASFLCYVKNTAKADKEGKWWKLPSLAFFIGALYTNPFSFFFLPLIIIFDLVWKRWRTNWFWWLIFSAAAGLYAVFTILAIAKDRLAALSSMNNPAGFSNPFFNFAYSFFAHLWLLIWPQKLTLYHEPATLAPFWLALAVAGSVLLLCLLPWLFKKSKILFFGLCLFILFLIPTFSPIMISWLVAERYLYFPVIALSIFTAYLMTKLSRDPTTRMISQIVIVLIIIGYSARVIARNNDWATPANLWRATEAVSPLSPRAHNNMGDVYSRANDLEKARAEFNQAVILNPSYADGFHNLANTYQQMGQLDAALANYQKAISFNPGLWQSYQNMGAIYWHQGSLALAKENFQKALAINPNNPTLEKIIKQLDTK